MLVSVVAVVQSWSRVTYIRVETLPLPAQDLFERANRGLAVADWAVTGAAAPLSRRLTRAVVLELWQPVRVGATGLRRTPDRGAKVFRRDRRGRQGRAVDLSSLAGPVSAREELY